MFHYVSELVIDSVMMHRRPLPYFSLPSAIADELRRGNIRRSVFFRFAYPIIFVVAKLPLYRMVHWIEQDKCPKPNFEVSICNFVEHIKAMTQSLRETFPRLNELGFNDVRVREVSTRLVFNVSCCDQTWGRVGIAVEEDFFFSAPLLASVL
jgi:hypothetical protein